MAGATYRDTPIPATHVFTLKQSIRGYRINKLAMSLTDPESRDAFKRDERSYMVRYGLDETEMELIGKRDWKGLVESGGNIYLLIKIGGAVGENLLQMGAQMRGQGLDDFMQTRPGARGVQRSE